MNGTDYFTHLRTALGKVFRKAPIANTKQLYGSINVILRNCTKFFKHQDFPYKTVRAQEAPQITGVVIVFRKR